jgi:general secretion pathway protein H
LPDTRSLRTRSRSRRSGGFTLIELLVVLVILGVLSTLIAISSAPDSRRETANEAERLRVVLETALQEAQLGGRPIAWVAEGGRYRFMQGDLERRWQALTDDEHLRPRKLAEGMRIAGVSVDGQSLPPNAFLVFASTTAPAFRIELDSPQGLFVLQARPNGRVDLLGPTGR